jgi:serine O-acetyltransferase
MYKNFVLLVAHIFLIPIWFLLKISKNKKTIEGDIYIWLCNYHKSPLVTFRNFIWLMVNYKAFRNVLYFRIKGWSRFISWLYRPQNEPIISVEKQLGKGLFFCHGFATIVVAKSIGENCWINQQVTIGDSSTGTPSIGNNVMIYAGALVLGNITIGDNAIIGAGAVVVKDVPANCTVVGNPARIVKKDGIKVSKKL